MCPHQNVDLTVLQFLEGFSELFTGLESVDVVHVDGKTTQAPREASVVLHGENGGRNQDGDLLSVGGGFESSADGNFCFSKAHITTNEAVHRS